MNSSSKTSVLIPSFNHRDCLKLCLESLDGQTCPREDFEVIVVLDGSTDGSKKMLDEKKLSFPLKVIEQENSGRASALNRAAQEASGDLFIVIDSDIIVGPKFIEIHRAAHNKADVVTGPIPLSESSPVNFLSDGVSEWAEAHETRMKLKDTEFRCSDIFGANISISRENFKAIGGYKENMIRSQDLHLGKKILDAGLKVHFEPRAQAFQIYDKTIPQFFRDWYLFGQSHVQFVKEYPEEFINLRISTYQQLTLAKWILTLILRHNGILGKTIEKVSETYLEHFRKRGSRLRFLASVKGVFAHAIYWRGVYEAAGDKKTFKSLIRPRTKSLSECEKNFQTPPQPVE